MTLNVYPLQETPQSPQIVTPSVSQMSLKEYFFAKVSYS